MWAFWGCFLRHTVFVQCTAYGDIGRRYRERVYNESPLVKGVNI